MLCEEDGLAELRRVIMSRSGKEELGWEAAAALFEAGVIVVKGEGFFSRKRLPTGCMIAPSRNRTGGMEGRRGPSRVPNRHWMVPHTLPESSSKLLVLHSA